MFNKTKVILLMRVNFHFFIWKLIHINLNLYWILIMNIIFI